MVTGIASKTPHRTASYLAACAAAILTASAVCCPVPAPATQGEEPPQPAASQTGEEKPAATPPAEDATASEASQEAPEPQAPAGPLAQPEPQTPAETPAQPEPETSPEEAAPSTNEPETTEPVPDKSRALETGVPVSNGASANPASVILDVATALELAGVSPEVIGVDASIGRVLYASET